MSDALYERYKDALRRGHVALLRDRLDAALTAYSEAAEIAPERSLPHASLGRVLQRMGRNDDALTAFAVALDRNPADETALAGRADASAALGRRIDAADALDRLAEAQEAAGRFADACDSARRALELAESRTRRRLVERLAERLREAPADAAAAAVLERTMGVLEPPAVGAAIESPADAAPEQPAALAEAGTQPTAAPAADGAALVAAGERRLEDADVEGARRDLLAGAAAHRAAGHIDAAIDACYLALGLAPAEPELHLTLAELYLERGWRGPAIEKLLLLGRLVELGNDGDARRQICDIAAEHGLDDPRLTAWCA